MKGKILAVILSAFALFSCGGCGNGGSSAVMPEKLLFHLDFEETGKYVRDLSGNIPGNLIVENIFNDAVFKPSSPALRREGVIGQALSFDGWSNFIDTQSDAGLQKDSSVSVNVWIAPRVWELPTDILCPIVEYYDTAQDSGFIFGYGKYGTWGVRIKLKDSGWVYLHNDNYRLQLYDWTNIGFSFDSEKGSLSLHKDGAIIETISCSDRRERAFSTLKVGINTYDQTGVGLFKHNMFSGLMDELCVYDAALSEQNVGALYERGLVNGAVKSCDYEDVQYPADYLKEDIYKPAYHASANVNWSSDASGGFYYNGMYHQFYQSDDTGPIWRTFTWGHLVSEDKVNWYNVEPAIWAEDNTIDSYSTFAGSAIVVNNVPYLIYTGIAFNDSETAKLSFATPVDLSDPELREWKKLDVVIRLPSEIAVRGEFRDPFAYQEGEYVYIIATASANRTGNYQDGDPSMLCFRAHVSDMTRWEYMGVFFTLSFAEQHKIGFMWELPQLYKLTSPNGTTKYMYTCTPVKSGDIVNDMLYWIGDFDKETCRFIPDDPQAQLLDKGSNVLCAGSGFYDPVTGKNMATSVVQCVGQRSEHDRVFSGWVGVYQLYRNYSLNDDGTLCVTINGDYERLHSEKLLDVQTVTEASEIDLSAVRGRSLHIKMQIDVSGSVKAGLSVLANKYGNKGVSFYYERENERFVLNTLQSGSEVLGCNYEYFIPSDGLIELDIYVDKSVVEFTVNNRFAFSARAFTGVDSDLVKFVGEGFSVKKMEVYSMGSIF